MGSISTALKGFKIVPLLWTYWYVWLTLIFILPTVIGSIQEARQENDYSIIISQVGGLFASSDNELYKSLQDFDFEKENPESTSQKIDYYASMLWNLGKISFVYLWVMVFMFICIYKFIRYVCGGDSASLGSLLITTIIILGMQTVVGKIPFKGVFELFKIITQLI